jgi:hypothetical protein
MRTWFVFLPNRSGQGGERVVLLKITGSPHRTSHIRPKKINPNTSSHFLPAPLLPLTLLVFIFSISLHLFQPSLIRSFFIFFLRYVQHVHSSSSFFLHSTCIVTKRWRWPWWKHLEGTWRKLRIEWALMFCSCKLQMVWKYALIL